MVSQRMYSIYTDRVTSAIAGTIKLPGQRAEIDRARAATAGGRETCGHLLTANFAKDAIPISKHPIKMAGSSQSGPAMTGFEGQSFCRLL